MDVDHPEQDQGWDRDARSETETERLDRNWASLLQELRVAQTGVQLLTGFLLTLPFQQRFDLLDDDMRVVYLVTVGCSICYDLRFPDLFQALAEKGAEMIAMPAAFTMQTGKDHWEVLLRARAIETETYVCASAQTGSFTVGNEQRHTYGHSLVADPWGHVVAKASDGVGIVSARIDPARVRRVRGMIPVADHRRRLSQA